MRPNGLSTTYIAARADILGLKKNGDILVRTNSVTGFNNNRLLNIFDQPTNIFFIKGEKAASVVPYNPNWKG